LLPSSDSCYLLSYPMLGNIDTNPNQYAHGAVSGRFEPARALPPGECSKFLYKRLTRRVFAANNYVRN